MESPFTQISFQLLQLGAITRCQAEGVRKHHHETGAIWPSSVHVEGLGRGSIYSFIKCHCDQPPHPRYTQGQDTGTQGAALSYIPNPGTLLVSPCVLTTPASSRVPSGLFQKDTLTLGYTRKSQMLFLARGLESHCWNTSFLMPALFLPSLISPQLSDLSLCFCVSTAPQMQQSVAHGWLLRTWYAVDTQYWPSRGTDVAVVPEVVWWHFGVRGPKLNLEEEEGAPPPDTGEPDAFQLLRTCRGGAPSPH